MKATNEKKIDGDSLQVVICTVACSGRKKRHNFLTFLDTLLLIVKGLVFKGIAYIIIMLIDP